MTKLRDPEIKNLTEEQENIFLAVFILDKYMSRLSDEYNKLERLKSKLLDTPGTGIGKYQGWLSINTDIQTINNMLRKEEYDKV